MTPGNVNKTLLRLIFDESIEDYIVLDVGCGTGALSFEIAPRAGKVIGIDTSNDAIEKATNNRVSNTSFLVFDAEKGDYTELSKIDMVVSHLCMSNKIIENSHRALPKGGVFAFACFHSNHLIEGGRSSRFSYSKEEMKGVLETTGFGIEYLRVEKKNTPFTSKEEALDILGRKTEERWEGDSRLNHLLSYIEAGGRSLTKSILVGKAQKI